MKSFGKWFADFKLPDAPKPEVEVELPEGIEESGGKYWAHCCCCGELKPIHCDISEIPMTDYEHYCGSGPHCCP